MTAMTASRLINKIPSGTVFRTQGLIGDSGWNFILYMWPEVCFPMVQFLWRPGGRKKRNVKRMRTIQYVNVFLCAVMKPEIRLI